MAESTDVVARLTQFGKLWHDLVLLGCPCSISKPLHLVSVGVPE